MASTTLAWVLLFAIAVTVEASVTSICKPELTIDPILIPFLRAHDHPFCMNSGTCKRNQQGTPDEPCDCPVGTEGPHCEFANGQVPKCHLECVNGGICQVGLRSYLDVKPNLLPEDYNYCLCPPGFYGKNCEVPGIECGSTHCLNGGECIQIERRDGSITNHCDCTNAQVNGHPHAGRFCQSPATMSCDDPNASSKICLHNGTCHMDPKIGCDCPSGYFGSMCEFSGEKEPGAWICNTDCGEHGFCRKGAKDNSFLDTFDFHDRRLTERFTEEFEHCVCEPGWAGLTCDVKMDICPGRSMVCLHGANCALQQDGNFALGSFECDCSNAKEDGLLYAGRYCQYHSSSFCTVDGTKPPKDSTAFCTNNGLCRDFVLGDTESAPGCVCDEPFEGNQCEILARPPVPGPPGSKGPSAKTTALVLFAVIVSSFLAILLSICLVVFVRQRRMQRIYLFRRNNSNASGQGSSTPPPYLDSKGKVQHRPSFSPGLESIDEEDFTEMTHGENASGYSGGSRSEKDGFLGRTADEEEIVFGQYSSGSDRSKTDYSLGSFHYRRDSDDDQLSGKRSDGSEYNGPNELEDLVQKRRRQNPSPAPATSARVVNRTPRHRLNTDSSSDIGSMSSMGSSSTQNFHKTIQMVDSFGSHARGEVVQRASSSDYGSPKSGRSKTSASSGQTSTEASKTGRAANRSQLQQESSSARKRAHQRAESAPTPRPYHSKGVAERTAHYSAIGKADTNSPEHPWRGSATGSAPSSRTASPVPSWSHKSTKSEGAAISAKKKSKSSGTTADLRASAPASTDSGRLLGLKGAASGDVPEAAVSSGTSSSEESSVGASTINSTNESGAGWEKGATSDGMDSV